MVAHVNRHLPTRSARVGEDALRALIRDGVQRANGHGFTIEYDVSRYIILMLMLGRGFDEDDKIPWAREMLADQGLGGGRRTMDALYERANAYLLRTADREGERS